MLARAQRARLCDLLLLVSMTWVGATVAQDGPEALPTDQASLSATAASGEAAAEDATDTGLTVIELPEATPEPVDADSQGRQLEEITVTARRREEGLQDAPVAVSALSGDELGELGITALADLKTVSPSLQFASSLEKSPSIFIRGVGQRSASFALDPGVGLYLNGIYIPRQDTQLLDAVDVASVQVLRGPQGTLFGKNNIGGAVLVDTLRPEANEFTGKVDMAIGDFGRFYQRVSINTPLPVEGMALRVAYDRKSLDGYIRNRDGGPDLLDEQRDGLSARLIWPASDALEVDLFAFLSRTRERGLPVSCRLQNPDAVVQQLLYRDADFPRAPDACRASEAAARRGEVYQTRDTVIYEIDNHITALTLRYGFDWGDLQSISSYGFQDNFKRGTDPDGSATAAIQGGSVATRRIVGATQNIPDEERSQFTQEFKLDWSVWDDALDLTAGVFAAHESLDNAVFGANIGEEGFAGVTVAAAGGQFLRGSALTALPSLSDFIGTEAVVFPFFGNFDYVSDLVNDTYAVFSQATWHVSERWELTFGARYTVEEREREVRNYVADFAAYANALNAQIGSSPEILVPVTHLQGGIFSPVPEAQFLAYQAPQAEYGSPQVFAGDVRFSRLTPNAIVSFRWPDEWNDAAGFDSALTYLTYSEGFKSGGLEIRGISALSQFDPEEVRSTELGFKVEALDRRLRLNGAIYHLDYTNLQVELAEAGEGLVSTVLFLDNAGSARVTGVELEATLLLEDWMLSASFAHTNGRFVDYTLLTNTSQGVQPVDRSGEPFPLVPENTASLVLRYDWRTAVGDFSPMLQAYYRDTLFTGLDFAAIQYDNSTIPDQWTLNARMSWTPTNPAWRIAGFVNNVLDDHYYVGGAAVSDQIGTASYQPAPPRHFGLEVSWSFD